MSHSATGHADPAFFPGHLGDLTRVVSADLVDAAFDMTGTVEHRIRRLPSRVIVYLLLAGALFAATNTPSPYRDRHTVVLILR